MIIVTVSDPLGREIYVNGVYDESRGSSPKPIMLNPGSHIFETVLSVGADRFVDFEGSVTNVDDMEKVTITLQPVVPRRLIQP